MKKISRMAIEIARFFIPDLDASSRVGSQETVKLVLDETYPADSSLSMFSIIRFRDPVILAA